MTGGVVSWQDGWVPAIRELILHASAPSVSVLGHMVQSFTTVEPLAGGGDYERHRFAPVIREVPGGYIVEGPMRTVKIHDGAVRYCEYGKVEASGASLAGAGNGAPIIQNAPSKAKPKGVRA